MPSWCGRARSNLFKVRDAEEYSKFCEKWKCKEHKLEPGPFDDRSAEYRYMLFDEGILYPLDEYSHHGSPTAEEFIMDLSKQLEEGSVAIIYEIGGEGFRFFTGEAVAINAKGEIRRVLLDDIHEKARELGEVLYMV